MEYIKAEAAAERWGVSVRRVQDLCKAGKVRGAERFGTNWMIPESAEKPTDGRKRKYEGRASATVQPKAAPFLVMTELYSSAEAAEQSVERLVGSPETQRLFRAQIEYLKGDYRYAADEAIKLLEICKDFYQMTGAAMLLGRCCIWLGDYELWKKTRRYVCEIPYNDVAEAQILELTLAAADLDIRAKETCPKWLAAGIFDGIPRDSRPAAALYFLRNLMIDAQNLATGSMTMEDAEGLALMRFLPAAAEPAITELMDMRVPVAEARARLICAIAYSQTGDAKNANRHIDRAVDICLKNGIYAPLVEMRRQLGITLDERINLKDQAACREVKNLHKIYLPGWTMLHNTVMNRNVAVHLSPRENEVARLVAFGMPDKEIAKKLYISESSVKSLVRSVRNKTGALKRKDFAEII